VSLRLFTWHSPALSIRRCVLESQRRQNSASGRQTARFKFKGSGIAFALVLLQLHQRRYPISATSFLLNLDLADPAPDGMFSLAFMRGYDG